MIGSRRQAVRDAQRHGGAARRTDTTCATSLGWPSVRVPVLSSATVSCAPARGMAALDQDAATRRRQPTMTTVTGVEITSAQGQGDDQQHQRLVCRRQPGPSERQRSSQQRPPAPGRTPPGCRPRQSDRPGAASGARLPCACSTAWMMCQHRVVGGLADLELERAVPVDGAGEHLVARSLVDRDALACVTGTGPPRCVRS